MSIRKREGHWHYRIWVHGQEHTGNTGLAATESNRKAATKIAEAKRKELNVKPQSQTAKIAFCDAAAKFVNWCQGVEYRTKESTARRIKTSFASIVEFFGERSVSSITAGTIEDYKQQRVQVHRVRDVTLRHDLHALSLFFQYAVKQGWAEANRVREVKIPSDQDAVRIHPVSRDEEAKYFEFAAEVKDRDGRRNLHDVAMLMLHQGCRPEEVMSSLKEDLDLENAKLRIRGGKSRAAKRSLDLTGESIMILKARMGVPGPWLFPSDRYPGRHITKLNGSHDRVCREAGLSFCLYDWRHAFGTRMGTELKMDPFTLARIMGHANLRTIMRYVHPSDQQQKEAMTRYEAAIRPRLKVVNS